MSTMKNDSNHAHHIQNQVPLMSAPAEAGPATASPALHPYACHMCRSRKVKCDKILAGCSNCKKAGCQCIYSVRRTQKSRRLQIKLPTRPLVSKNGVSDEEGIQSLDYFRSSMSDADGDKSDDDDEDLLMPREMRDSSFQSTIASKQMGQGRLFVADGKSRYIDSRKANEMASLEILFCPDSKSEEELREGYKSRLQRSQIPVSGRSIEKLAGSSLFGMTGTRGNIRKDHPPSRIIDILWNHYIDNVDLLVKILYKPAVEAIIMDASKDLKGIDASTEALLFAIYFAAVRSMTSEDCSRLHGEQKNILLRRYRLALEQALVQAGWMVTQEIAVLQAMILLIYCAPGKHSRFTWTLSGVAVGIAQGMGMHRDSATFLVSNIDIEVRRRVWWTLCVLDNRISDDCGLESHIPLTADTKIPLNINDLNLANSESKHWESKAEFTEMTMSLIKIEITEISTNIKLSLSGKVWKDVNHMETEVQEKIRRYEETYLTYFDRSNDLHSLCYLGGRLMIAKLRKMACDLLSPSSHLDKAEIRDRLISCNTDILEVTHQLPDMSSQFGWWFLCKYTHLHATVYLLLELCKPSNTQGPVVEKAWRVLNSVFNDSNSGSAMLGNVQVQKSTLWQPLLKLLERARHVREQATLHSQLQMQGHSESSRNDSGCDTKGVPAYHLPAPENRVLLGNPFLGSTPDFDVEMNWDNWDALVETLQDDVLLQQDCMDYQESGPSIKPGWW